MQIIFGTKRLGKVESGSTASEKYPNKAVVTLEGVRGHGKSRRLLFNRTAMEVFGLENGIVNQVIFGHMIDGDNRSVLISNANDIVDFNGMTIYKTSKNAVSYDESKEKGKAVSSSIITGDIAEFLSLDDSISHEFTLEDLNSDQIEAQRLILMNKEDNNDQNAHVKDTYELDVEVADPLEVSETPAQPVVDDVNWDDNAQDSQVNEGLTRATVE